EKKSLGTINAIQESLHAEHPSTGAQIMPAEAGFSHSLGRKRTSVPCQESNWLAAVTTSFGGAVQLLGC
ncbi:hypothetical protein, partial [Stenotrophomonas maltophilia]|uniref:hypothetical protein n=1 Tax=Stenotrophomonas maltophilia TaxID=40324 RepID=UPI001A7E18AB